MEGPATAASDAVDPAAALWPDIGGVLSADLLTALADGAAGGDERGATDDASIDLLRRAGYFGAPVPVDFEGLGQGVAACCAMQRRLAAADPGIAVALNMHLFSLGVLVEHWRRHRDKSWLLLEAIASQGRLIASGFAEPGLGGSILRSNCTARRVDDGWVVNGVKSPCSLARRADLICVQFQDEAGGPEPLVVGVLPANTPGLRVVPTWDALGLRASESDTVLLEDCHLPDELVFHRCPVGFDADLTFNAGLVWFCLSATATYLGVAWSAVRQAAERLASSRVTHLGATRSRLPTVQAGLGDAVAQLTALDAACAGLATAVDAGATFEGVLQPALALRLEAAGTLPRAVERCIDLVGASAYAREGALARAWRDVQGIRFHAPTPAMARQALGRLAVGEPFAWEISEAPR